MVWLTDARTPDGMRLYAIGDVHGRLDKLSEVLHAVEADIDRRPVADWRVILLGDYVDRGPDSRGVIDLLLECQANEPRVLFLRGNHDAMFAGGIAGDRRIGEVWLKNGGVETLESYDLTLVDFIEALREERSVADMIPAPHRAFLDGLEQSLHFGDYYFVHAGVDPDRALDEQDEDTQLWIRDRFLASEAELDAVVVHGHTPVQEVDVRANRIGIDTGAVFGGPLSCLVLEGAEKALLVDQLVEPLPIPARSEAGGRRLLGRVLRLGRR